MDPNEFHAVGKRKRAIAKVWLRPKSKSETHSVNGKSLLEYFCRPGLVATVEAPLILTEKLNEVTVVARTLGGGLSGQADALRLGIARALEKLDGNLRSPLRNAGMLTRDGRVKERKKYGLAGARKRYQFSKR